MIKNYLRTFIKELYYNLFSKRKVSPLPTHNGKEFEIRNDIISHYILNKLVPIVGINPYPLNELSLMVASVCFFRPSHIFEWGTNVGKSARIFYETCRFFSLDTEIHTIDLPDNIEHEEHPHSKRGFYIKNIKSIQQHLGDGVSIAMNVYNTTQVSKRPFFFLDGDHSYDSVLKEIQMINEHISSPVILIHDTFFQSYEAGYNVGPFMAIQDFLKSAANRYDRIDTHLGLPGMTLLYPNAKK